LSAFSLSSFFVTQDKPGPLSGYFRFKDWVRNGPFPLKTRSLRAILFPLDTAWLQLGRYCL